MFHFHSLILLKLKSYEPYQNRRTQNGKCKQNKGTERKANAKTNTKGIGIIFVTYCETICDNNGNND